MTWGEIEGLVVVKERGVVVCCVSHLKNLTVRRAEGADGRHSLLVSLDGRGTRVCRSVNIQQRRTHVKSRKK